MFHCLELQEHGLFFGLGVYTNKPKKPTRVQIKKLVSYDLENWIDCGKLCDCSLPLFKGIKSNVHIGGILAKDNTIEVFLQLKCFYLESSIKKYSFNYNSKKAIIPQIKRFKCVL